jgi:hypothetical protein
MDQGQYRWHDVTFRVEGRERLTTPAGTFDAWKVLLADADIPEDAFRFWIACEAGIVRLESITTKNGLKPWQRTLSALDLKRPDRTLPVPALDPGARARLEELIGELSQSDAGRRTDAEKAIRTLGVGAVPLLRTRAAAAGDAEVRARLEAAARSISGLKVEARARQASVVAGKPLPVELLLRNEGPDPVLVLPSLPGAAANMDRKHPAISAHVIGPDGKEPSIPLAGSFWGSPPLRGRDFRRLYPGESLDLFAEPSADLPAALAFPMSEPGAYAVRLVYDISGGAEEAWSTEQGPPDGEAARYLAQMPRGRFEPAPVTVTVVKKK